MSTIGSMFSGYGGLDLAVQAVIPGDVVWHCETDPAAVQVLAHHWPGVSNLGDVTTIDWDSVSPVDILTAGFPCQDISFAGRGAGIEGARSGLWRHVADAVRVLRPRLVVLENVAALVVRGLDRVLTDLAGVGYDVRWTCVRASDVDAPHRRRRWFAVAYPSDAAGPRWGWDEPQSLGHDSGTSPRPGEEESGRRGGDAPHAGGEGRDAWRGLGRPTGTTLVGNGAPTTADAESHGWRCGRPDWGQYEAAIRRWETVLGHSAPAPTVVGQRGGQQLNSAFVEWMMGVPGHITSVPGLSRNDMLRLAGNGVVPQQGAAALQWLLSQRMERAA